MCKSSLRPIAFLLFSFFLSYSAIGQNTIEGYAYEKGNRGFISNAEVAILNTAGEIKGKTITDEQGKYVLEVNAVGDYELTIVKLPYFNHSQTITKSEFNTRKKVYLKHELSRSPGYIFEITLAERNPSPDSPKDALVGAYVEVYNNTAKHEVMSGRLINSPEFAIDLIKGNHYTILIRKEGFLTKRMEAYIDVEDCILCFEGIGTVTPGVADNLSEENTIGVLLANVDFERTYEGKVIALNNIYYDVGKSDITEKGKLALDNVASFLLDNPQLKVELGSHTDSRGKDKSNLKLSQQRAKIATEYLVNNTEVPLSQIVHKGYGEIQLVNKCENKSKCTESDHAKNRRTELRVTGIVPIENQKSLRQMKVEEFTNDLLANLGGSTQIQVAEGETIEDAIERQTKATAVVHRKVYDLSSDEQESADKLKEVAKVKVQAIENIEIYSGYSIAIKYSRFLLKKDDELHESNPNLTIYKTADGNYIYLKGAYDSNVAAQKALKMAQAIYEDAYLIKFEEGVIVN